LALENSLAVPVKFDYFATYFLRARRRYSENLNEKLELAGALIPCIVKMELLQNCSSSGAVRPPTEITMIHAASAS
jgi:hypothetical protein